MEKTKKKMEKTIKKKKITRLRKRERNKCVFVSS